MLKIRLASRQPIFQAWPAAKHLQARGSNHSASKAKVYGVRDVSKVDGINKDEVTLANEIVQGGWFDQWEKQLEKSSKTHVALCPELKPYANVKMSL